MDEFSENFLSPRPFSGKYIVIFHRKSAYFLSIVKNTAFLEQIFVNGCSMKALRDFAVVAESQATPATLVNPIHL